MSDTMGARMQGKPVPHFEQVDLERVRAVFVRGRTHRALLKIPFRHRPPASTLCLVGQNPSDAGEEHADKTVRYLERYVHERLPQYGAMLMLNLYTRVDKRKEFGDVEHPQADRILRCAIRRHQDFLFVFGQLKNEGKYRFPERLRQLQPLFIGKNLLQFDLATDFPPHPGNAKILYSKLDVGLKPFLFVA
ncbi:DUF1643 domain-containing protein [Ramlibacter henchirensis]|uniref:DUF1643 domain-containing protein n=1 Tax=Ramlibacter henchirensis TaxID=204072 RepID=A0A4Z0C5C7_9BURK|nr:DUF1643 domain-containing protein [Ramlibacter henchirensis]TFZ05660.1 DUF1643 domain-containing protein [Ramlibacter henchirensis]